MSGPAAMVVDKSAARVCAMFGQIARRYDRMNHLLSFQVDRYWRWKTVRVVHPQETAPILDVCTGTGDLALAYWRAGRGRVRVVGCDFCPQMLEVGRDKARRQGASGGVEFVQADAQDLPLADNQFQIVAVAFGLRNLSDTERGLSEMVRVCRPGGRVVILEFSMPTRAPLRSLYRGYFCYLLPRIGQCLVRNQHQAYAYLPASVQEFPQPRELVAQLEACGLVEVRWRPLTGGIASLYVGVKPLPTQAFPADVRAARTTHEQSPGCWEQGARHREADDGNTPVRTVEAQLPT